MLSEFGSASDPKRPDRQADWYAQVPRVLKELEGVKAALQWNYRDPGPNCNLAVANDRAWASLRKVVADPQPQPATRVTAVSRANSGPRTMARPRRYHRHATVFGPSR